MLLHEKISQFYSIFKMFKYCAYHCQLVSIVSYAIFMLMAFSLIFTIQMIIGSYDVIVRDL